MFKKIETEITCVEWPYFVLALVEAPIQLSLALLAARIPVLIIELPVKKIFFNYIFYAFITFLMQCSVFFVFFITNQF